MGNDHSREKCASGLADLFPPCWLGIAGLLTSEEQYDRFAAKTASMSNPQWELVWQCLLCNNPLELDRLVSYKGLSRYKTFRGKVLPFNTPYGYENAISLSEVFYMFILPRKACVAVYLQKVPLEVLQWEFGRIRPPRLQYFDCEEQCKVYREMIKDEVYRRSHTKILLTRLKLPLELIFLVWDFYA